MSAQRNRLNVKAIVWSSCFAGKYSTGGDRERREERPLTPKGPYLNSIQQWTLCFGTMNLLPTWRLMTFFILNLKSTTCDCECQHRDVLNCLNRNYEENILESTGYAKYCVQHCNWNWRYFNNKWNDSVIAEDACRDVHVVERDTAYFFPKRSHTSCHSQPVNQTLELSTDISEFRKHARTNDKDAIRQFWPWERGVIMERYANTYNWSHYWGHRGHQCAVDAGRNAQTSLVVPPILETLYQGTIRVPAGMCSTMSSYIQDNDVLSE